MAHVELVEPHPRLVAYVGSARDLPKSGDARLHRGVEPERLAVLDDLLVDDRSRPDDAHFAAEHVPHLRQLVEAELAEHPADAGDARVVAELLVALPLQPGRGKAVQVPAEQQVGTAVHRAELPGGEPPPVASDPPVAVQRRAGARTLNQRRDAQQKRQADGERDDRHHDVQQSLHRPQRHQLQPVAHLDPAEPAEALRPPQGRQRRGLADDQQVGDERRVLVKRPRQPRHGHIAEA